jgi:hypothetical protein
VRNITTIPGLVAIGCLIAVSSWWLVQLSTLPQLSGVSISQFGLQAARIVLLLQLLSVSLFAPFWLEASSASTSLHYFSPRIATPVLFAIFPAWPFLAILWLVTGKSVTVFLTAELSILCTGLILGLLARLIRRENMSEELVRLLQTTLGISAATLAWLLRDGWLAWIGLSP